MRHLVTFQSWGWGIWNFSRVRHGARTFSYLWDNSKAFGIIGWVLHLSDTPSVLWGGQLAGVGFNSVASSLSMITCNQAGRRGGKTPYSPRLNIRGGRYDCRLCPWGMACARHPCTCTFCSVLMFEGLRMLALHATSKTWHFSYRNPLLCVMNLRSGIFDSSNLMYIKTIFFLKSLTKVKYFKKK